MGPSKQCSIMFKPDRRLWSIALFASMILTLVIAFVLDGFFRTILLLICVGVEFAALFWYIVLLIPGGKKVCCACFKCCKEQITQKDED